MNKLAILIMHFACLVTATMTLGASETRTNDNHQTVVSIQGDKFLINGVATYCSSPSGRGSYS